MEVATCSPEVVGSSVPGVRYLRQIRLPQVGLAGQNRLRQARVLVLGAGGLGAPVLQYLAAAGVGTLGIIDDDVVEETNLHRQVIHDATALGEAKVDSAARRIKAQVGDEVNIEVHPYRLIEENAPALFRKYDLVVDGADNFPTRYLVADVAATENIPVVWGSILGFNAQVSVFWASPPPELGSPVGVTLRDLFPNPPAPGTVPSCAEAGVIGALCGQTGSIMAMEALKLLGRFGESLFGHVMVIDTLRAGSQTLQLRPGGKIPKLTFPQNTAHTPTLISGKVARAEGHILVDVREPNEYTQGHAAGALSVPLSSITAQTAHLLVEALQHMREDRPLSLYCQAGVRARQAASLLGEAGLQNLFLLEGDFPRWQASGAAIEYGQGTTVELKGASASE